MKRILLSVPALALLIAAGALFLTRGGTSPDGTAEASAQVTAAFVNVEELASYSSRQTTVTFADGKFVTVQQEMSVELPDRIYVRTTIEGKTSEAVLIGERVFGRRANAGADWMETDLRAIGIDPESLDESQQEALIPHKLILLGDVTRNSIEMSRYTALIDGQEVLDLMRSILLDNSALGRIFQFTQIKELEVEYLIGKQDQLPYYATSRLKFVTYGQEAETVSKIEFFGFNEPLILPLDLPLTP